MKMSTTTTVKGQYINIGNKWKNKQEFFPKHYFKFFMGPQTHLFYKAQIFLMLLMHLCILD